MAAIANLQFSTLKKVASLIPMLVSVFGLLPTNRVLKHSQENPGGEIINPAYMKHI